MAYSVQLRGLMRQQLVLPRRHMRGEVPAGDGVLQPAGEIPPFQVEAECLWVQMPYRGPEVVHRRRRSGVLAVYWSEVEPSLVGQGDVGVFVAVPYVRGPAACDGERTSRLGSERNVARCIARDATLPEVSS
jgi:hypothetical protein